LLSTFSVNIWPNLSERPSVALGGVLRGNVEGAIDEEEAGDGRNFIEDSTGNGSGSLTGTGDGKCSLTATGDGKSSLTTTDDCNGSSFTTANGSFSVDKVDDASSSSEVDLERCRRRRRRRSVEDDALLPFSDRPINH